MNTPVIVTTLGRVTADLELKTSQNGKNTKFVQFGFAVSRGFGENSHPNFYNCLLFGDAAQRMIDAGVKKGSLLFITGEQELEEFARRDGTPGWNAKITLLSWSYVPINRPKDEESSESGEHGESGDGFVPTQNCGENGLPFN